MYTRLTTNNSIRDIVNHPAFEGFGEYLLPRDFNSRSYNTQLRNVGSLMPYHSYVNPDIIVGAINYMIDEVKDHKTIFYNFYTEQEKQEDLTKECTGLFFFRGNPGARRYQMSELKEQSRAQQLMVGGTGPKKTLRMVAQYADACNIGDWVGTENMQKALGTLRAHCDNLERDYDTIEKTSLCTVNLSNDDTVAGIIKRLKELSHMGFTHTIFNMPDVYKITPLETFAKEIIPAVADL